VPSESTFLTSACAGLSAFTCQLATHRHPLHPLLSTAHPLHTHSSAGPAASLTWSLTA
jgi:hypothetical protein